MDTMRGRAGTSGAQGRTENPGTTGHDRPEADTAGQVRPEPALAPAARQVSAVGAVRVTLAASSAHAGLAPCVVEADGDEAPRVDGVRAAMSFQRLDDLRGTLASPPGRRQHVLLFPTKVPRAAMDGVASWEVVIDGWRVEVELESADRAALRERARRARPNGTRTGPSEVRATIPGIVVSVAVAEGDTVHTGDHLVVVEAMKMQNEVRAPRDGNIGRVGVTSGQKIEAGDVLLVIN